MELELTSILDFCSEPMLALKDGIVFHINAPARTLFPFLSIRSPISSLLPQLALPSDAGQTVTAMHFAGQEIIVRAACLGDYRLLCFHTEHPTKRGLLSEAMMGELNSALFNISLTSHRLAARSDFSDPDARRSLALLQHSYHRLLRQFSNLDILLRLSENASSLSARPCDVVRLCTELADAVNSLNDGTHAKLKFSSPLETLSACVDPTLTERLILNLLSNSFNHCAPESTVRLGLDLHCDRLVLSVDDDGCGIPADVLQNVFTRYENRLCPENLSQPQRSGLGLSVARGIALLHGGSLILESRPGHGTSVRVMLPTTQPGMDVLHDAAAESASLLTQNLLTELSDVLNTSCYEWELLDEAD